MVTILSVLAVWNSVFTDDYYSNEYWSLYEDLQVWKKTSDDYENKYFDELSNYNDCQKELDSIVKTDDSDRKEFLEYCDIDYLMENYQNMEYEYFDGTNNFYNDDYRFDVDNYINQKLNKKSFLYLRKPISLLI